MKKGPLRRSTLTASCLLIVSGSILGWLLWCAVRQERLNHALLNATHQKASGAVPLLLRQGADPNVRETAQLPHSWREILQRWLHRSAVDRLADTALMLAARQGDILSAQWLVEAGADVNAVNGSNETALAVAFTEEHAAIMKMLLTHGANPNVKITDYTSSPTPLLLATLHKFNRVVYGETTCRDLVRLMLDRGVVVRVSGSDGETPLLAALQAEEPEIAQGLIAGGADINKANRSGETPLWASTNDENNYRVLETLLQRGVDVATAHNGGWNLLCWAAETDNVFVAKEALRRGMSINSPDKQGRTPLMYAAAYGSRRVLNLGLAQGANVNIHDHMGWTALMFAAQRNNMAVVSALLEHGADTKMRDLENHWTAEQRAVHGGQEQIAHLLRTKSIAVPQKEGQDENVPWNEQRTSRKPARTVVDGQRWIEGVRCPEIHEEGGDGAWGVVVVDRSGRRGEPFGGETFFFQPAVQIFPDTDGHLYAFVKGHHRAEANFIVAVRQRTLIQKCEFYAEYGVFCQPLAEGGALILGFERARDRDGALMEGLPIAHEQDRIASISRFRQGKLTPLDFIFLPRQ